MDLSELKIDPEFAEKIPRLTDEEFAQLKTNILSEGRVIEPLITWKGIIVDGHNRYRVLREHPEIPFTTYEKEFPDRYAVIAWICLNQLGRRNLTPEQKLALVGLKYKMEKMTHGGDRKSDGSKSSCQNDNLIPPEKTSDRVARELGISPSTVIRSEKYLDGLYAADEVLPGIKDEILSRSVKPTQSAVIAIGKASPDKRKELVENLRKPKAAARGQPIPEDPDPDEDAENLEEDSDEETEPYIPSKASIRQISAAMASDAEHPEHRMPTEFIIEELTEALDTMIFRWDFCLSEHRDEANDTECRRQIQVLVEKGRAYLKLYRGGKKRDAV